VMAQMSDMPLACWVAVKNERCGKKG